jgi:hypothetical protein
MTNFNDWHAKNWPLERVVAHEDCWDELQEAYEAGAASQSETLRDKFAGQALEDLIAKFNGRATKAEDVARSAYDFADAMIKARKIKGKKT